MSGLLRAAANLNALIKETASKREALKEALMAAKPAGTELAKMDLKHGENQKALRSARAEADKIIREIAAQLGLSLADDTPADAAEPCAATASALRETAARERKSRAKRRRNEGRPGDFPKHWKTTAGRRQF